VLTAGRHRRAGVARGVVLALIGAAGLLAGGCGGGGSHSPAALHLQREDLAAVSRGLAQARVAVAGELVAAKAAWPSVANGLPAPGSPARSAIAAAVDRSSALPLPALFGERAVLSLTGPAAGIGGLYRRFVELAGRGWRLIGAALEQVQHGSPGAARFARANVALYIESVYDAHFGLAQIGKKLLAGYHDLGGADAFGASLSEAEVRALAGAYSEASVRLHPHTGVRLGA
jgi:hypothetical protein